MTRLNRFICACATALALAAPVAHATSAGDVWYTPTEGGWGMNVVQQGSALGFAIYVYDLNQNPIWFLGSGNGNLTQGWTGQMYAYHGPYFGGAFDPASVSFNTVGSFSFALLSVNTAALSYSVNGVTVTKNLTRLNVGNDDMTGVYGGALVHEDFNCSNPAANHIVADGVTYTINQTGTAITIGVRYNDASTCTYNGTYSQTGRYGNVVGNYSCSTGLNGSFSLFEVDSTSQGFNGRFTGSSNTGTVSCAQRGRMGGVNLSTGGF